MRQDRNIVFDYVHACNDLDHDCVNWVQFKVFIKMEFSKNNASKIERHVPEQCLCRRAEICSRVGCSYLLAL